MISRPPTENALASVAEPRRKRRPSRRSYLARRRERATWAMSLNLTPMIDTVFNLLFFFMVMSRFGSLEGLLEAALPARSAQAAVQTSVEIPRTPIRLSLIPDPGGADDCVVTVAPLRSDPIAIRGLAAELGRIRDARPGFDADTPVYLLAADDVIWNHVVNAYNAAVTAGYKRVFFSGAP